MGPDAGLLVASTKTGIMEALAALLEAGDGATDAGARAIHAAVFQLLSTLCLSTPRASMALNRAGLLPRVQGVLLLEDRASAGPGTAGPASALRLVRACVRVRGGLGGERGWGGGKRGWGARAMERCGGGRGGE